MVVVGSWTPSDFVGFVFFGAGTGVVDGMLGVVGLSELGPCSLDVVVDCVVMLV